MQHLPWDVVYGEWIWRAAAVALAAGALYATFGRPRRALRAIWRRAMSGRDAIATPDAGRAGSWITIAGTLEADRPIERFEDGAEVAVTAVDGFAIDAVSRRSPRLAVITGSDVRVELRGEVQIEAGSTERIDRSQSRLPAEVHRRIGAAAVAGFGGAVRFRSLRRGDPVVVSGILELGGASEGADYRESGHRFALREVTAISAGPPVLSGPPLRRALGPLMRSAAVFAVLFGLGGECADSVARREHRGDKPSVDAVIGGNTAARLMTWTPLRRGRGLEYLEDQLDAGDPTVEIREALVAVAGLRGDCESAARTLLSTRRYRRALEVGARCDAGRATAATAAFALGELERASDLVPGDRGELAARYHILAGRFDRAAAVVAATAGHLRDRDVDWLDRDAAAVARRDRLAAGHDCLAAALRARAGVDGAVAQLRALMERTPSALECRLLLADLAGADERIELLAAWPDPDITDPVLLQIDDLARLLLLELPGATLEGSARLALLPDASSGFRHFGPGHNGVHAAILERLEAAKTLDPGLARARRALMIGEAVELSYLGRAAGARRILARARDGADPDELRPYAALVELRAGDLAAARAALGTPTRYDGHRLAELIDAIENRRFGSAHHMLIDAAIVNAALGGDLSSLERELREGHYHSSTLRHLAELSWWLPADLLSAHLEGARVGTFELEYGVDTAIGMLGQVGQIAAAAEDRELADTARTGAMAIREASRRRDVAVPLAVLEAL